MSDNSALKRLYSSSSSASACDTPTTTTATTPDPSQSRHESEHDASESDPSTTFNPAKVSSKLTSLAASARAAAENTLAVPGSDEGHATDPLLRVYDPTKDASLSIEQLLARPRLPRTPFERASIGKKLEEQVAAKKLLEQSGETSKKADREKHMKLIRDMAKDLDPSYVESK